MDRAKYQVTAPPDEKSGSDEMEHDKFSTERKNYRRHGKTPGGRSGKGTVVSAKRSTFKRARRRG
jgi:hypothetical protein